MLFSSPRNVTGHDFFSAFGVTEVLGGCTVPTFFAMSACLFLQPKQPAKKAKAADGSATPAANNKGAEAEGGESSTVFVGNLAWASNEDTLTEHLKGCGKIKGIRVGE